MMLRNGWYTENEAGSIFSALAGGAFIGSSGQGEISSSSATRADDAEAVVAALSGSGEGVNDVR